MHASGSIPASAAQISSAISALPSGGFSSSPSNVAKYSSLDGRLRMSSMRSSKSGDSGVQITSSSSMNPVPTRLRLRTESGYGMPSSPHLGDQQRVRLRTESTFGMLQSPYIPSQWSVPPPAGSVGPVHPTALAPQPIATASGSLPAGYPTPAMTYMGPWGAPAGMSLPTHPEVRAAAQGQHLQLAPLLNPAGVASLPAQRTYMQYPMHPQVYGVAPSNRQQVQYAQPQPVIYKQQGQTRVVVQQAAMQPHVRQGQGGGKVVVTAWDSPKTTAMLRNLPSGFSRDKLTRLLDSQGFAGTYDFAYLPFDFETLSPLTHAFVNFALGADAERCHEHFEGFTSWPEHSDAVCGVAWNDRQQGLPSLVERYRNSPVMHESVPEECKPMIIIGGQRAPFPPPTQRLKAPKIKGGNVSR